MLIVLLSVPQCNACFVAKLDENFDLKSREKISKRPSVSNESTVGIWADETNGVHLCSCRCTDIEKENREGFCDTHSCRDVGPTTLWEQFRLTLSPAFCSRSRRFREATFVAIDKTVERRDDERCKASRLRGANLPSASASRVTT